MLPIGVVGMSVSMNQAIHIMERAEFIFVYRYNNEMIYVSS